MTDLGAGKGDPKTGAVTPYPGLPRRLSGKRLHLSMQEPQMTWVCSLDQEDSLEEEMATHSCLLVRKIPWTEESGRLQSMRSQRIRHD